GGARTTMLAPALKLGRQGEHRGAAERVKDMLDRARGQAPTGRLQAWRCELEEEPEPARPAAPASAEEEALARVREQVLTAKDFLRRATSAGLGALLRQGLGRTPGTGARESWHSCVCRMFSEAQLRKLAPKRVISQAAFDEAVKDNVETFEMEQAEAIDAAIKEFESQGVDLASIVTKDLTQPVDAHPAVLSLQALASSLESASSAAMLRSVRALLEHFVPPLASEVTAKILLQKDALVPTLGVLSSAWSGGCVVEDALERELRQESAALLSSLVSSHRQQRRLLAIPDRALVLSNLLHSHFPPEQGSWLDEMHRFQETSLSAVSLSAPFPAPDAFSEDAALLLQAAAAAATQCEDAKVHLVRSGAAGAAVAAVATVVEASPASPEASPEDWAATALARHAGMVQAACRLLVAVTSADDDSLPSSSAFAHARALGKDAVPALTRSLQVVPAGDASPLRVAVCSALKQLAANEELCKAVLEHGGVDPLMEMLASSCDARHPFGQTAALDPLSSVPALRRSSIALVRQLASADAVKAALLEQGVLDLIGQGLRRHAPLDARWAEHALGALANLLLRQPEASARAAQEGGALEEVVRCVDSLLDAACGGKQASAEEKTPASPQLTHAARIPHAVRQGCQTLRNAAARSPEARERLTAIGAERTLRRAARWAPDDATRDAARAALRDIGCDDYMRA
ncbi:hypothetical protein H632_c108p0, partial [Helicosporidium sp. ATCC 50920]